MKDLARIMQRLTRIKQRWGAPFNVTTVEIIRNGDVWVRRPRAVALMPLDDNSEILVYFAGEGRTFQRFIELAKEHLADYQTTPGDGHEIAFGIIPRTEPKPKE